MPRKKTKNYFWTMGCLLVLFFTGNAFAGTFVLDGDYIRAGVSNSGGLIDDGYTSGIQYDPTGHKNFGTADYLKPAAPLEFFSIGMDGQHVGTAGFGFGNSFNATTTNTSGTSFSAHTEASSGQLGITQDISFSANSSSIIFNIMLTNKGSDSIIDLAYARGLDPDQDAGIGNTFETFNTVYSGNAMVSAVGLKSGMSLAMRDISGGAVANVALMETNPYNLFNYGQPQGYGYGDYSISLAYLVHELEAGKTAIISFAYDMSMKPVPLPPAAFLFLTGLAGLGFFRRKIRK